MFEGLGLGLIRTSAPEKIVEWASLAESSGFHSVWVGEDYFQGGGYSVRIRHHPSKGGHWGRQPVYPASSTAGDGDSCTRCTVPRQDDLGARHRKPTLDAPDGLSLRNALGSIARGHSVGQAVARGREGHVSRDVFLGERCSSGDHAPQPTGAHLPGG